MAGNFTGARREQVPAARRRAFDFPNVLSWYNPPALYSPEFRWDKVAEVKVEGPSVVISGITPALTFHLPSEALAARLGFAMEFLRTSCDGLGRTGF